jgi:hypothetical protein
MSSKTSKYRGVCLNKNKWKAQINFKGVNKHLGTFCDEKAAARAYDKAAFDRGKLKCLNFPQATETETVDRDNELFRRIGAFQANEPVASETTNVASLNTDADTDDDADADDDACSKRELFLSEREVGDEGLSVREQFIAAREVYFEGHRDSRSRQVEVSQLS